MALETRHIRRIVDTEINIKAYLDDAQIAILTDLNEEFVYTNDDNSKLYYGAAQYYWDGLSITYCDAEFNQLEAHSDILVDEYIKLSSATDNSIRFAADQVTIAAGGVNSLLIEDDRVYTPEIDFGIGKSPDSNRRLHIYESTDDCYLEIESNEENAYLILNCGTDGGAEAAYIFFQDNSLSKWRLYKNVSQDFLIYDYARGADVFQIEANGNLRLMENGGSVGINTPSPSLALEVTALTDDVHAFEVTVSGIQARGFQIVGTESSTPSFVMRQEMDTPATGTISSILTHGTQDNDVVTSFGSFNYISTDITNTSESGYYQFKSKYSGSTVEYLEIGNENNTIVKNGNFGINITPESSYKLHVAGEGDAALITSFETYSTADGEYTNITLVKSDNATVGTLTETLTGHTIGSLNFAGINNVPERDTAARIIAYVTTESTGAQVQADLNLETWSSSGANTNQLVLRGYNGCVGINVSDSANISGRLQVYEEGTAIPIIERGGRTSDSKFGALKLKSTKTTNMGDGFGVQLTFQIEDDTDVANSIGKIGAIRNGADNEGAIFMSAGTDGAEEFCRGIVGTSGEIKFLVGLTSEYVTSSSVNTIEVGGNAYGRLVAAGSTAAGLSLLDTGGTSTREILQIRNEANYTKFRIMDDSDWSLTQDDVIVIDMTDGHIGFGKAPEVDFHFYTSDSTVLELESYANNCYLYINSGTDGGGSELSNIYFQDNSSNKWKIEKDASNNLNVYDYGGTSKMLEFETGAGMHTYNHNIYAGSATINDDSFTSFTPGKEHGLILINCQATGANAVYGYDVSSGSENCTKGYGSAGTTFDAAVGALDGTTGNDGSLTVSANDADGKIYIENRTGST